MNREESLGGLQDLMKGNHPLTNLANASAVLWEALPDINWVGFYLLHDGVLCLGPFQGKAACTRIEPGRGVCGTALVQDRTLVVPDVHAFPGHIACDAASRSEVVVPLHDGKRRVIGVLDVDSPLLNRFQDGDADVLFVEEAAKRIEAYCCLEGAAYNLRD